MSFTQAVKSAFANYFTLSGRSSRSEYWYFALFCILGSLLFGVIDGVVFGAAMGLQPLSLVFSLATFIPSIALLFRRLHDVDKSGWWGLLAFIPVIGWLALLYFMVIKGTTGPNRFGADPLGGGAAETPAYDVAPAE